MSFLATMPFRFLYWFFITIVGSIPLIAKLIIFLISEINAFDSTDLIGLGIVFQVSALGEITKKNFIKSEINNEKIIDFGICIVLIMIYCFLFFGAVLSNSFEKIKSTPIFWCTSFVVLASAIHTLSLLNKGEDDV